MKIGVCSQISEKIHKIHLKSLVLCDIIIKLKMRKDGG